MASRSVNKVILLGNLGKDAETRFTPQGIARTTFGLATSRRWKDQQTGEWKEETDWHNVVLWRSENLANYLTKGKKIYVEGRLQSRSYDDKDGNKKYVTEVVADDVILVGGRDDAGGGGGGGMSEAGGYAAGPGGGGYGDAPGGGGGGGPVSMPRSAQQQRARPAAAAATTGGAAAQDPFGDQGVSDDDVPF